VTLKASDKRRIINPKTMNTKPYIKPTLDELITAYEHLLIMLKDGDK